LTTAFVFPGQGSQSLGMQSALAKEFDEVAECYGQASEVLGYDLWQVVQNGPAERLDDTVVTQPAMLTAGVAAWRIWRQAGGGLPEAMAGHSLGEYTALVCSGAFNFVDALRLVQLRAQLMQAAVPRGSGAMAAILGLEEHALMDICDNASGVGIVEAVNFNSPGQIVVAGHREAVKRVVQLAHERGARRAIMLHVSVPSHSSLMRPAGEALAEPIHSTKIRARVCPVISSVDARPYRDAADIREQLKRQVSSPVRWVDTVQYLVAQGIDRVIECGPGKVLTGLTRRIDKSISARCIDTPDSLATAVASRE
jgi:[acyl-carrier-protein] S-malonyltransferase